MTEKFRRASGVASLVSIPISLAAIGMAIWGPSATPPVPPPIASAMRPVDLPGNSWCQAFLADAGTVPPLDKARADFVPEGVQLRTWVLPGVAMVCYSADAGTAVVQSWR